MSNPKLWKRMDIPRSKTGTTSADDYSPERTPRPGPGQSFVFSLDHRPRATRASVPKVRSGCITCKRRHVKCDEAKPACQRCLKWQGFCDGYKPADQKKSQGEKQRRSSASSRSERSDSAPASGNESQESQNDAIITPEMSQFDSTYLANWLNLASNFESGLFPTDFYTVTVPQMCQDEMAIRYAVLAVGALISCISPSMPAPFSTLPQFSPHYSTALTYYGHALRLVGLLDESTTRYSIRRVSVIACGLFVVFEILHGNHEAAIEHINHGGRMINGQPLEEQSTAGNPSRFFLENTLICGFHRVNYLAWTTRVLYPSKTMPRICPAVSAYYILDHIPSLFAEPVEARYFLSIIQHQNVRFIKAVTDNFSSFPWSFPEALALVMPSPLKEIQQQELNKLKSWKIAFWPLLASIRADYDGNGSPPRAYLQVVLLLLQFTILEVSAKTVFFHDRKALEEATPQFSEMVQLSEIILSNQPPAVDNSQIFTMDNQGQTFELFVAATKCADEGIRNQATELMRRYPRRDAFWETRVALAVLANGETQEEHSSIDPRLSQM
ncbi:hypothetical protein QBC38DRAFT_478553 [Podospora fimiseda]|uniref:Zn(2)-C6 fungal-type domain-containing protein n=1 Tax=Podospora fimiseda TaxID=252190 RepID=A0AAN7BPS4_9PEZI|nr:hypothetical protein QBC38DRAFT_478553 [Podospora fimiseda]